MIDAASPRVVGVDLGGTKIAAALVDASGDVGEVRTCLTPAAAGPQAVLDASAGLVREVAGPGSIAAVGVGSAGVVDPRSGRVLSATDALAGWAGTDLRGGLAARLGARVTVDNDVNAHAVGEAWRGAGRGVGTMLLVTAGTGVGAAIVVGGRPLPGRRHMVGEIGHLPARGAEGLRCGCGREGHLEAVASGPGLVRHHETLSGRALPDARAVVAAAHTGDATARRAVADAARALGTALAAVVTTLDPDVVVLGGGLAGAGPLWWDGVESALRAELVDLLADVPLRTPALGGAAAVVGAARLAQLGLADERATGNTTAVPHPEENR